MSALLSHSENPIIWTDGPDVPIDRDGPVVPFTPFDLRTGPERPVWEILRRWAAVQPDHLAVRDDRIGLSYAELLAAAGALAQGIMAAVPAGRPVGIRLPDGVWGPVAQLACLAAATPGVLLNPADPPERLVDIISGGLAAVITFEDLPGHVCLHPQAVLPASPVPHRKLGVGEAAFIVLTSGSSGRPKGIVQSQRSVLYRAGMIANASHLSPADRYMSLNAPASLGALLHTLAAWVNGASIHRVSIAEGGFGAILRRVEADGITALIGVPAVHRAISRLGAARAAFKNLRLLGSNAEALLAADLAQLRACLPAECLIQIVFGSTETPVGLRFIPPSEVPAAAQVAAGRPAPDCQFALLDEEGAPVAPGEAGELFIRSRYTAIGEWQEGRVVPGRLVEEEDGWRHYAMGDLARLREDGALVISGRADRQMKINGHRVEPVEVEAALRTHPAVVDAAVLPVPGPLSTDLVAFAAADASAVDGAALLALAREKLPPHMVPHRLHVLPALPLLPGNKVDIFALRKVDEKVRK